MTPATGPVHGHRARVGLPAWGRVATGAVLGHALGALVGVVVVAGPAARLGDTTALVLVHVIADVGTAVGAGRAARLVTDRALLVVATVAAGLVVSLLLVTTVGTGPAWLLARALVVVAVATALTMPRMA